MPAQEATNTNYLDIKSQLIEVSSGLEELFIHMQNLDRHETLSGGELRLVGQAGVTLLREAHVAFGHLLELCSNS